MQAQHDEIRSPTMGGGEWAMLLGLSVLWGGSFFFNAVAARELPSLAIVWLRVAVASAALVLGLFLSGRRMPTSPRVWAAFLVMGLLNNVIPFGLIVWGQHRIASGLASILNATTPLFTAVVAHLLTRDEKLTARKAVGVAMGFLGVAVMIGPKALEGLNGDLPAETACLGAALSYALAGVYGRRFKRMGVEPMATAAGQVCASTAMLLPLALVVDAPWALAPPGATTWAAVAGLGLVSTALAYILYFRILAKAGATNVLLVTLLVPVSAILLGAFVLHEALTVRDFAGMTLIGAGLAWIDGRLPKRALSAVRAT